MALSDNINTLERLKFSEVLNQTAVNVIALSNFEPPKDADAISATYPSSTQEVYQYRSGGIAGTVLKTVTINYTDVTKEFIQDVAFT
jgi:hypothetical protein